MRSSLVQWKCGGTDGAGTKQAVQLGLKLFQELGERNRELDATSQRLETQVKLLTTLLGCEGVAVPTFERDEQLQEWLGKQLAGSSGPLASRERVGSGGHGAKRARAGTGPRRGGAAGSEAETWR